MRKHGRRDGNHTQVKQWFEQLGATVADTADLGDGFVDLVIGIYGVNEIVEVKIRLGKLTADEEVFLGDWKGSHEIVRTFEDVVRTINLMHWKSIIYKKYRKTKIADIITSDDQPPSRKA